MPVQIDREHVQTLLEQGAQLVEVLPADAFEKLHLPGALSMPLEDIARDAPRRLDRSQPVITYCFDHQWDLSARAAARLESLGFKRVYRYTHGKMDWLASDLPREGTRASVPRAGDLARRDVPTCRLADSAGSALERMNENGVCVVVDDRGTVLGLLRAGDVRDASAQLAVEQLMDPAPTTYRVNADPGSALEYMDDSDVGSMLVTTSDGRLVGLLTGERIHQAAGKNGA